MRSTVTAHRGGPVDKAQRVPRPGSHNASMAATNAMGTCAACWLHESCLPAGLSPTELERFDTLQILDEKALRALAGAGGR